MPKYRVTQDYEDSSCWTDIDAASMDEAAQQYIDQSCLDTPGIKFWVAIRDRDGDFIAEMKGYETYRPKQCRARELLTRQD